MAGNTAAAAVPQRSEPDAPLADRYETPAASPAMLDQVIAGMTLADLEEFAVAAALQRCNNNRTRAARALGISVRTLQRKVGLKNEGPPEESESVAPQENMPPTNAPDSLVEAGTPSP